MSRARTVSCFIVYELLLNWAQVGALPALAGIFVMRTRCQNLRPCPGRGNCHSGFVVRASTNGGPRVNNIFLPPLSFLWLMSGVSWICTKPSYPTHWTSLIPFPFSHTFCLLPSPHYSSFKDVRLPPRLWAVKSLFFPPCLATRDGGRKLNSLDVSFLGHWALGCCCFLSVLPQLRQSLTFWWFLGRTLPSLCCS